MIAINIFVCILIYISTLFFIDGIFRLYNAEGLILNYAVGYYKIRAIGLPLTIFTFSVFGIFRGMQNTYWPRVIIIAGTVLNIVLDYAFVFGIEGFIPAMHIEGAAYASVIAQGFMALLSWILVLKKTPFTLKLSFPFNKEI
jgi:Na+-driven multidrug efflux pump